MNVAVILQPGHRGMGLWVKGGSEGPRGDCVSHDGRKGRRDRTEAWARVPCGGSPDPERLDGIGHRWGRNSTQGLDLCGG
jgi:hypothetical protein